MLETVRQFGEELLAAEGEADAVRAAHGAFFAALAEAVAPGFDGAKTIQQRSVLRADQDNFRAALDWFYQRGDAEGLLLLTRPLCIFWGNFGPWTEGSAWIERALTIEQPPSPIQAEILVHLGATAGYQGNFEQGTRWLNQARDVAVELGAPNIESFAITVLGAQQVDQGFYAEGETLVTEALTKATLSGDPYAEALACAHLGVAVWGQGRVAEAESLLERARASMGHSQASVLPVEIACRYLGLIAAEADDPRRAAERYRQSSDYDSFEEHKLTRALPNLATLAVACGLPELATRLLGATDTISRITRFVPAWPERGAHDRALSRARVTLGESAAATAFSAGQEMTSAEIQIAIKAVFAAAEAPAPLVAREQADSASQLTLREREVLRLIADGLSNTEIGDRLFISHRTAQTHVTNILAKLGATTRTEAAARAVRDGLI
jgi:DNA-binding CsgD family transcriptional regulator